MREVVDGVIEIPIAYVHAYAVVVDDGVVLVDTGLPGRADKVVRAIEEARHRIGEVHTILLTHWHPDHVGGVAELRRRSGARIVAHAGDVSRISGAKVRPRSRFMRVVGAVMPAPEPVPVDETLTADGPISVPGSPRSTPPVTPQAMLPSSWTGPAACCSRATRPGADVRDGFSAARRWSPKTPRLSRRASPGSLISSSTRLCLDTAVRYPTARLSGSENSQRRDSEQFETSRD